jgi:hypothetical protein
MDHREMVDYNSATGGMRVGQWSNTAMRAD